MADSYYGSLNAPLGCDKIESCVQKDNMQSLYKHEVSHLEVIRGRISILSIRISNSPGKEKYCFSWKMKYEINVKVYISLSKQLHFQMHFELVILSICHIFYCYKYSYKCNHNIACKSY